MPSRSSNSSKSSGSASVTRSRTRSRAACCVKTLDAGGRAQQPRNGMEWDLAGVRFAEGGEHLHTRLAAIAATSRTRRLLPMPGGPTTPTTAPWPSTARSNRPSTADISHRRPTRFDSTRSKQAMPFLHAQQPLSRDRLIGTLDLNQLTLAESRCTINQSRGRCAEHHPTRRSDRLHPLGHPHLLTDCGVTERPRTHFTGDHLARVQADPQLQLDTVAVLDVDGKPLRLFLDAQGRQTGTNSVILQRRLARRTPP